MDGLKMTGHRFRINCPDVRRTPSQYASNIFLGGSIEELPQALRFPQALGDSWMFPKTSFHGIPFASHG